MLFMLASILILFSFADGMLFSAVEPLRVPEVFIDRPADVFLQMFRVDC